MNIDIIVLGTNKKRILTTDYLQGINYKVYLNGNWEIPKYAIPNNVRNLSSHPLEPGPYRCFRGHQEALKLITKDSGLIFEDDAVPNRPDWQQIVEDSAELLTSHDIVSLHARHIQGISNRFRYKEREYVTLGPTNNEQVQEMCWAVAALAYLVKKESVKQLSEIQYCGIPWDIAIYNLKTAILVNSPFDHDRRFGSVIENRMINIGVQRAR